MTMTKTTVYRVIQILTNDFGAYNFGEPSDVTETIKWSGTDLDVLSIQYPPSQIMFADPLGHSEIEDGLIRYDYRFERQCEDGSWEKISDPRRRLTPITDHERAIDAENRRRFPGDHSFYVGEDCQCGQPDCSECNPNGYLDYLDEPDPVSEVTSMRIKAIGLAGYLLRHGRRVVGIELFGSLARGGGTRSSDFDMIVVVDGFTAALWHMRVLKVMAIQAPGQESIASVRRRLALKVLEVSSIELEKTTGIHPWKQDFFLFPPDWRQRLPELQMVGSHKDPEFMANIARDARTYVPSQGFPFPVM